MATIILGSDGNSIERKRTDVSETDPDLDTMWDAALAAGQVSGEDTPDAALKAARLSAINWTPNTMEGKRECVITTFSPLAVAVIEICGENGVVSHHFASGTGPSWVESDSPTLAAMIAEEYGCPIGRPDDWETVA